jgi:hypothetical protein
MLVYVFIITMFVQQYGGTVNITVESPSLEGCQSARRSLVVGMRDILGPPKESTVVTKCESRLKVLVPKTE